MNSIYNIHTVHKVSDDQVNEMNNIEDVWLHRHCNVTLFLDASYKTHTVAPHRWEYNDFQHEFSSVQPDKI